MLDGYFHGDPLVDRSPGCTLESTALDYEGLLVIFPSLDRDGFLWDNKEVIPELEGITLVVLAVVEAVSAVSLVSLETH